MRINIFRKKKSLAIELGRCGIIESTEESTECGIDDKFNKKIVIYEGIKVLGNTIKWGKIIEEMPYTEEEVINLIKIKEIPIVERKIKKKFDFKEGAPFGDILE